MIVDLKPYPEYKESGVPWLGMVPNGWDVSPLARLARPKSIANQSGRQLLSVYLHLGVVRFADVEEKRTNPTSEDLSRYQAVDPGDFVLNNQQAWRGSVGVSNLPGVVSPAYLVLGLSDRYLTRYANLLFRDPCMVLQYLVCSKGVGTIQRNLYWPHLKRTSVVVPPPAEQAAIVRFLDWANGRLERAIRAKRKVIALLNEQKQAIIHRAVTRGLDPSVPLKPSGIPWIGDIPQHWEVRRLGRLAEIFNGSTPSRAKPAYWANGTVPWIASGKINDRWITTPTELVSKRALEECSLPLVLSGSVLLGLIGQGRTRGMSALLMMDASISQNLAAIVPRSALMSRFTFSVLIASYDYIRDLGRGSSQPALNCDIVGRLLVPVPPMREQLEISQAIEAQTHDFETAVSRVGREIELLREYRTRLVADVVTGKLDVREAVSRLPEEFDPAATNDEPDPDIDPEETEAEAAV
jgi:type I restriction enzyme S subunit